MTDRTSIEHRVGIDVPDLVGAALVAFSGKVALRLAADADHLEELHDRIVLSTIEDLAQREPFIRDSFQSQHASKLAVPIAEGERIAAEFEEPDADRQRLEHVRQQLDRLAVGVRALRGWRRGP